MQNCEEGRGIQNTDMLNILSLKRSLDSDLQEISARCSPVLLGFFFFFRHMASASLSSTTQQSCSCCQVAALGSPYSDPFFVCGVCVSAIQTQVCMCVHTDSGLLCMSELTCLVSLTNRLSHSHGEGFPCVMESECSLLSCSQEATTHWTLYRAS